MSTKQSNAGFDLLARVGDGDRETGFFGLLFLLVPIGIAMVWGVFSKMGVEELTGLDSSVAFIYAWQHFLLVLVWIVSLAGLCLIGDSHGGTSARMTEVLIRFGLPVFIPFAVYPLVKFFVFQSFADRPFWTPQPWWINHFSLLFSLFSGVLFCVSVNKYREIIFGILSLIRDSIVDPIKSLFGR